MEVLKAWERGSHMQHFISATETQTSKVQTAESQSKLSSRTNLLHVPFLDQVFHSSSKNFK